MGRRGFYRSVPDAGSLTFALAARALFLPGNRSVLHVVGLHDLPAAIFRSSQIVAVRLSPEGFARILEALDACFARADGFPQEIGTGLYGPSLFYRATGSFHVFNVCNHWVARLLGVGGLPTSPLLAVHPQGLLLDLKWRAGLVPLATREPRVE